MIALGIFVTSIGVLLTAQTSAARNEAHARNVFTAAALARDLLTQTELEGYPEPIEEQGDFGNAFPGYTWKRSVRDAVLDTALLSSAQNLGVDTSQIAAAVPGLREIHLTVLWTERETQQNTEIVFYAVKP
jgi:hypothetical protein